MIKFKFKFKSEYTIKDVEKSIKDSFPKEIELVFLLSNNAYMTTKHSIK